MSPVVAALRARRDSQSLPLQRRDKHRIALAVDGGGMRGIVSASMLAALQDLGYGKCFDAVYGVSAGAINSAYFIIGDGWPALTVYYDQMTSRSFIDWRRPLRRAPLVSVDFIIDEVMKHRYPLDYRQVVEAPVPLHVILTSLEHGTWHAARAANGHELQENLRASASVPLAAGSPVNVNGHAYVDGAMSLAHPALAALQEGYTHVVTLRTRARVSPGRRPSASRRAYNAMLRYVDESLVAAYARTHAEYVHLDGLLNGHAPTEENSTQFLDVSCPTGAHGVGPTTQDMAALMRGMRAGYEAAHRALEEAPGRALIRPVISDR